MALYVHYVDFVCFCGQLQVSVESLSTLLNIGFMTKQSRRDLRMYGQDIQHAVYFSIEERERIAKKEEEDRQQYRNIRWVLNSGGN